MLSSLSYSRTVSLAHLFQNNPTLESATIIHHSLLGFHPTSLLPLLVALSRPQGLGDQSQCLLGRRGPEWPPLGWDKGQEMRGWPLCPSLLARRCQMSQGLVFGVTSSSFVSFLLCWRDRSRCEKSNLSSHGFRRGRAESLDNDIFHLDITRNTSRYCPLPVFCLQRKEMFRAEKHTRLRCLQTQAQKSVRMNFPPRQLAKTHYALSQFFSSIFLFLSS